MIASFIMKRWRQLSRGEYVALTLMLMVAAGVAGYNLAARRMAAVVMVNPGDLDELAVWRETYGPDRNSEHAEEWIVRDFFKDARDGVFVDVGANHHQRFSNTYYLETALGWSGVAIEPQTKFADGYKQFRPKTTFVPLFVSDVSNQQTTLFVTSVDLVASGSREFTESFGGSATPTPTTTTTLDDVLDRLGITRVDFVSMDIELAEPQALAGFSINRFRPRLLAVEAHPPVRQQILDYFTAHGYSLVGKYWRVDSENFWFAPAS
jgi:FkbM family methyltransferase